MDRQGAPADVEVVLLRMEADALHYRFERRALCGGERPDDLALRLASVGGAAVCHSTSWRYEDGTIVLTYAVVPDPFPMLPATILSAPAVMCSGDPLRPTPLGLHPHHVAAHAVRHLAYLADTDPVIAAMAEAEDTDGCWAAVRRVGARTPVAVHAVAHRLAADSHAY